MTGCEQFRREFRHLKAKFLAGVCHHPSEADRARSHGTRKGTARYAFVCGESHGNATWPHKRCVCRRSRWTTQFWGRQYGRGHIQGGRKLLSSSIIPTTRSHRPSQLTQHHEATVLVLGGVVLVRWGSPAAVSVNCCERFSGGVVRALARLVNLGSRLDD
jgi:hypothetical protein